MIADVAPTLQCIPPHTDGFDTRAPCLLTSKMPRFIALCSIILLVPLPASGDKPGMSQLPGTSEWAAGFTDPAPAIDVVVWVMDRIRDAGERVPPRDAISGVLKARLGVDLLTPSEYSRVGVDTTRGIYVHGSGANLFGRRPSFTFSIATNSAQTLRPVILKMIESLGRTKTDDRKVRGKAVRLVTNRSIKAAVYETRGWLHVSAGDEAGALVEAARVLKSRKTLEKRKLWKSVPEVGGTAFLWANAKGLLAAMVTHLNGRLKEAQKDPDRRWRVQRIQDDLGMMRMFYAICGEPDDMLATAALPEPGRLAMTLTGTQSKKARLQHLTLFPDRPGRFDTQQLSRENVGFIAGDLDAQGLVARALSLIPGLQREWRMMKEALKSMSGVDLELELLPALRSPATYVFHGIKPFTPEELADEGASWSDLRMLSRIQHAMLLRIHPDQARPLVSRLVDWARRAGATPTASKHGSVELHTIVIQPQDLRIQLGLSGDTLILGSGPLTAAQVDGWLQRPGETAPYSAAAAFSPQLFADALTRTFTGLAALRLREKRLHRDLKEILPTLLRLTGMSVGSKRTSAGYSATGEITFVP